MTDKEKQDLRDKWDTITLDARYSHHHRFDFWISKLEIKDKEIARLTEQIEATEKELAEMHTIAFQNQFPEKP